MLVPWQPGCPHREAAWDWVWARYTEQHPDWQLIEGTCAEFSRTRGILSAFTHTDADVLVVADADVWCDGTAEAVARVEQGAPWAVPHLLIHRLSRQSTAEVLAGDDWHGLPLSTDNEQDSKPYRGHEAGTLLVLSRAAFSKAPPDARFVAWGQEDAAWATALRTLVGLPWRGEADLVHLWHPPQQRLSRVVGSTEGKALLRRYRAARTPDAMRTLVDEAREAHDAFESTSQSC